MVGCIHGRFQPFHNGHNEYLLAAAAKCDRLIVGITQYEPEIADDQSPAHRMTHSDNPFTYWERSNIIRAAIANSPVVDKEIDIVPFPIHSPDMIRNFVDPHSVMFTTIYDTWNIRKIRRLKEHKFPVVVLWRRRIKEIEGKSVRSAMRQNFSLFEGLVPLGVAEAVRGIMQAKNSSLRG